MKYVILSGVSGGMGLATCKKLIENGYHVFGLDIKAPKEEIKELTFIKTDLRDAKSIEASYIEVSHKAKEIDAIISMAGIYDVNSLVEMSEEAFIRIFDINVFAIYRLNKIYLPLLKERGKVIVVSSELAPLDPLPFTGIYGITQLLNKQVIVIRPGAVDTTLLDDSTSGIKRFSNSTELYKYNANKFMDITNKVEAKKISPEKIAKLTYKILKKKKPKYVYKINRNKLLLLLNILPDRLQNYIIRKILLSKNKKSD